MRKAALWLGLMAATGAWAQTVPDRVNYQGVLRNPSGAALNGSYDMIFRFFDAAAAGNEILVDRHENAGGFAVVVTGGLFQVELGGGVVSDGAAVLPGDPYTTLAQVFTAFGGTWMEIAVGQSGVYETLSPRTHVVSAPYALRAATAASATAVGGVLPGDILTTSAAAQTKAGSLQINGTLTAGGNTLSFGQGSTQVSSASDLIVTSGNSNGDDLLLRAGNSAGDGSIEIQGLGPLNIRSGAGNVSFLVDPTAFVTATLDATGTFTATNDLVAGGSEVRFGSAAPFASVAAAATGMTVIGGDGVTDDLLLYANLNTTNGSVEILGQGPIVFRSGDGNLQLSGPSPGSDVMLTAGVGSLTVGGDLTAAGSDIRFGHPGAQLSAIATGLSLLAGDGATDALRLQANGTLTDGAINIWGNGSLEFFSGSGNVFFTNGDTGTSLLQLSPAGHMTVGNILTVQGKIINTGNGGQINNWLPSELVIYGGSTSSADLILHSTSLVGDESSIYVYGQGSIRLDANDGKVVADQDLWATRHLVAEGRRVYLGGDGAAWMERNATFDDVFIARDFDNNHPDSQFAIFTNVGVTQMRILDGLNAETAFDGPVVENGLDYAEAFLISDPTLKPGEVVVFDPASPGHIRRAEEPYSSLIAGVISTRPGFVTGSSFEAEEAADPGLAAEMKAAYEKGDYSRGREISSILQRKKADRQRPVALAGRLPVLVDAAHGPIRAGDHLTSSATPGHAMAMREAGPSLGVALEGWEGPGTGVIMAFVQRGHHAPPALAEEAAAAQASLADSLEARTADPDTGIQRLPSSLQVVLDAKGEDDARFSVFRDGDPADLRAEVFRVDERGNVWAQGTFRPRSMDLAETFELSAPIEAGDVLTVDRDHPGRFRRSDTAADPAVVGVVSSDPGVLLGGDVSRLLDEDPALADALDVARVVRDRAAERAVWAELERRFAAAHAAVALSGTVRVKVDAEYGAIAPGDLLVSSPTPGHAMRAPDAPEPGTVIGKALEGLEGATGVIRMLVMLR